MAMIKKEDILQATEYGKTVILHYYPQAAAGFSSRRNFRIRPDDRKPSGTVFFKENTWFLQDKGGTDTRAYNAVSLVMEKEGINFPQALEWIAAKFAPHLLEDRTAVSGRPEPVITRTDPSDVIDVTVRPGGQFTEKELSLLGWKISQEICDRFCLKPVSHYVTRKNAKGQSYRVEATDSYPIYYYDYGKWGKIYQPLGDVRFMYVGQKPEGYIFGDERFRKTYDAAVAGRLNTAPAGAAEDEYTEDQIEDERMEHLIICSGPSDALNAYAAGYNVCWPNSESEDIDPRVMSRLFRCAKYVSICYDADETGLKNMYALALKFLDLRVIRLPKSLASFRTRNGKPCKDIKDYMMYYRKQGRNNPHSNFQDLVKTSHSLKFWRMKDMGQSKGVTFDISNVQLFRFLEAHGYYTMPSVDDSKGFKFIHVVGNRVAIEPEDGLVRRIRSLLLGFLRENTIYYTPLLEEHILRSRQITLPGLEGLEMIKPDFTSWSRDEEWVFFRNTAVRITAKGIETVPSDKCPHYILEDKVIQHDFHIEEPFFEIRRTDEAEELLASMERAKATAGPRSPEYIGYKQAFDRLTELGVWTGRLLREDCTYARYVWNTGRTYWRKEEQGLPLGEAEVAETELNFVNKCMAIGYMLSKFKEPSKPYAVYCLEIEEGENGEHNGGTGKSLFADALGKVRNLESQDGQNYDPADTKFLFGKIKKDITDIYFLDDLHTRVDLHKFMPVISGDMSINVKYQPEYTLKFKESPKLIFTSNHAIRGFDSSLRRRTFFAAFSDYYHPENRTTRTSERTPASEFGKNLIADYNDAEMNAFYNFMLQCLHLWMRYRLRVNPPMKSIEMRTLRKSMGEEFIFWAEEWFDETRLDCEFDKVEAYEAYLDAISDRAAGTKSKRIFRASLQMYCQYKGWELNPDWVLKSPTEKVRGEIRRQVDGKDRYYFYIDTHPGAQADDIPEDEPPFK